RAAQIARRFVGFLERQILRLGAAVDALDQLIDPLHLLAQQFLGRGLLRFSPFADRRFRRGIALLDRLVETLALLLERRPLARYRLPGVRRGVFLPGELLGFARELVETGARLRGLLAVLVTLEGLGARLLEARHEPFVCGRLGIRGQPFPLGARDLEAIERVISVNQLDGVAQTLLQSTSGGELRFAGFTFGALARVTLERCPCRRHRGREPATIARRNRFSARR